MRLSNKAAIWIAAFAVLFVVVGLYAVRSYRDAFEASVQANSFERSGEALKLIINRSLNREWDSLDALANSIDVNNPTRLQGMADTMPRASRRLSWAGFISTGGIVEAGTGGAEVGWNVSKARWFRSALRGPTLSDPFQAKSGSKLASFINLAYPVRRDGGQVAGVLVYRLSMEWLENFVTDSAKALGMDAFVVDSAGNMLVSAHTVSGAPPSAASLHAARLSMLRGLSPVETREAGYVSASIPRLLGNSLRSNDWTLIVRMPNRLHVVVGGETWHRAETALIAIALMVGLCLIAAMRMFLRPIEIQSQALIDLTEGKFTYPPEFHSSREARDLGASLAFLQTQFEDLRAKVNAGADGRGGAGGAGGTGKGTSPDASGKSGRVARLHPVRGNPYRKAS